MSTAVKVKNLVKSYGNNTVIKDISFEVYNGEIFALLGTNGAGKTTTLECIEGLRKYNSGIIKVDGSIGVQLQSSSLPGSIKAFEAMKLFGRWKRTHTDLQLLHTFGLDEIKNKQYKDMSTGQKRRLHLALALIGNPDIVFLDEPTAGLDVEGRTTFHEEIRKLKQCGKTIILASHDMAEVESLCDRIAILKEGNIAFLGTANELTQEVGGWTKVYIKTTAPVYTGNTDNYTYEGKAQDYSIFSTCNIRDGLIELLTSLKQQNNTVIDIKLERASLEQRFMDIAKEVVL